MKSLNEDLKTGQFKQIYLLYGEESYLKRQYRERLVRAMIPEGDTMNYAVYEGKNIDIKEVIDLAETLPFPTRSWRCCAAAKAFPAARAASV